MKLYLNFIALFCGIILLTSFNGMKSENESIDLMTYEIPDEINSIFLNSCIMCHNDEAKNEKAKKKLMLDEISSMSKSKLISKLSKISKAVSSGDMPPEKFTSKYPDKKLSEEDKNTLIAWSKNYAEELAKE